MPVEEGSVFFSEFATSDMYLKIVVVFLEHCICHATETDLKVE